MALTKNQIIKLGRIIRPQLEAYAKSIENPIGYGTFNPKTLKCMCAVGAYIHKTVINRLGGKAQLIKGQFDGGHHCWVAIDNKIYDLTATQFNKKLAKVLYLTPENNNYKRYKIELKGTQAIKDIKKWGDQSPFKHKSFVNKTVKHTITKFKGGKL